MIANFPLRIQRFKCSLLDLRLNISALLLNYACRSFFELNNNWRNKILFRTLHFLCCFAGGETMNLIHWYCMHDEVWGCNFVLQLYQAVFNKLMRTEFRKSTRSINDTSCSTLTTNEDMRQKHKATKIIFMISIHDTYSTRKNGEIMEELLNWYLMIQAVGNFFT